MWLLGLGSGGPCDRWAVVFPCCAPSPAPVLHLFWYEVSTVGTKVVNREFGPRACPTWNSLLLDLNCGQWGTSQFTWMTYWAVALCFFVWLVFWFLKTGFLCPGLTLYTRLASQRFTCLSLPNAGIKSVCYHTLLILFFLLLKVLLELCPPPHLEWLAPPYWQVQWCYEQQLSWAFGLMYLWLESIQGGSARWSSGLQTLVSGAPPPIVTTARPF